ncbi:Serine/threonine-protein kinase tel1 [Friedmanniomyces endolithicus]|nr:Serine/threonine-protein kinase tel1 [Friedmanniomyces endolithicus]KAK1019450.1 Serine/threonine-protein kinase tel1 [Friedmanniomyces endolithicus]
MSGQLTLQGALEQIQNPLVKERKKGFDNLKHVLRYNQQNPGAVALDDVSFDSIYKQLFAIVLSERSTWLTAKTTTTQSAADSRLSDAAVALRLAVELGVQSISLRTVRAVVDHVIDTLPRPGGGLCVPLALDYVKCLKAALSYQPHLEHQSRAEWERAVLFCVHTVQGAERGVGGSDARSGVERTSRLGVTNSSRSSRSQLGDSAHESQTGRNVAKQVSDELVACLSLLTAAPNAPLASQADTILWTIVEFLKTHLTPGNSHQNAITTINNVLLWARTDDLALVKKAANQLIRLVRHFWPTTRSTSLKDDMLVTLLYLQPYMAYMMQDEQALILRTELCALAVTLRNEYGKRKEGEQLQIDELKLVPHTTPQSGDSSVKLAVMDLRPCGLRAEHNWALIRILAILDTLLRGCADIRGPSSAGQDDDEDDLQQRPRKRQRLTDDYEDALRTTASGTIPSRVGSLQVVTFIAQQKRYSAQYLSLIIDTVLPSCSDEDTNVAAWALLALASCASQLTSTDDALKSRWASVWQLGSRSLSNVATCRATCHLLDIMLRLHLVVQTSVAEFLQEITASMELSGPSVLADSSLHLLRTMQRTSQQLSPGKTVALAEGTIVWLCRHYAASMFDDKSHTPMHRLSRSVDVVDLVNNCLDHQTSPILAEPIPVWNRIAQALVTSQHQHKLISYLLLLPDDDIVTHPNLQASAAVVALSSSSGRLPCETLLLNQLIPELQKALNTWKEYQREGAKSVNPDMLSYLCHVCYAFSSVAFDGKFLDTRRQAHMQRQLDELLGLVAKYVGGSRCGQPHVDAMLLMAADQSNVYGRVRGQQSIYVPAVAEHLICRHVSSALHARARQRFSDFDGMDRDDDVDLEDTFDSQDSRRDKAAASGGEANTDSNVAFSVEALRAGFGLYALTVARLEEAQYAPSGQDVSPSSQTTDYLMSLPVSVLVASRKTLSALPTLGLHLSIADAERLLEYCTENILANYMYERSEVAQGTMLALMLSLLPTLTDSSNQNLFDLGIDMYDLYVRTLEGGVLSVNVQHTLGALFLSLCEIDADYGRSSDVQSARTSLFKLVQVRSIRVQYSLADQIPIFFGMFVLSAHDQIFADLQAKLPADIDWHEGMAMRLRYLAKLASAWRSLLRQSVYYIFETAGHVKEAAGYATLCIQDLSKALGFTSAQELFRLFAPQLLYTWLEEHTLTGLPYAAFQYVSLENLIECNLGEIIAQLLRRGKDDDLRVVSKALNVSEKEAVRRSFAQSFAYAICTDVSASAGPEGAVCEKRIRDLVGGKGEVSTLVTRDFAAIMGHFYLVMQQDDVQDIWLDKSPIYPSAAKALAETRSYSHSTLPLPPSQQPSFKSKFLPHQIERICRRAARDVAQPWDASSFALAARMLLDATDQALGPLHMCLMLRKLRVLICMAGNVAHSGYPLEMLVHSIRPFLSESQCADDAIGILQYLLHHGQPYLRAENAAFTFGTICVMVLQMQAHSAAKHESTTQGTQHQQTLRKMEGFQSWLHFQSSDGAKDYGQYTALATALGVVRLPGNARKGTAESTLLLVLLEQHSLSNAIISEAHSKEALRLLAKDFEVPLSAGENCIDSDETCNRYADSLWHFVKWSTLAEEFVEWAAEVIGRAYASAGLRPSSKHDKMQRLLAPDGKPFAGVLRSEAELARQLTELTLSPDRLETGLADWTLRAILYSFKDPADALSFEQMLPTSLVPAVSEGTYSYEPRTASERDCNKIDRQQLCGALDLAPSVTDQVWIQNLAIALCKWASERPILSSLPALLRNIPRLASDLLLCIAHIILTGEVNREPVLRQELSSAISKHLKDRCPALDTRRRLLLDLLLYLRSQPWPSETTKADRVRWLDVDFMLAADASARCGMPSAALLFAESSTSIVQAPRKASSRASLNQLPTVDVPEQLLLSIFRQVDEPDSFYGVQQPASLESILGRLDYESDGIKSLMFRTARMDSAMRLSHEAPQSDAHGMMRSLSALNLYSLEYALTSGPLADSSSSSDELLNTARKLQQWDMALPQTAPTVAATRFSAFQHLSCAVNVDDAGTKLRSLVLSHMRSETGSNTAGVPSPAWCNALASLTEALTIVRSSTEALVQSHWSSMQARQRDMLSIRPEDAAEIAADRSLLFSVLSQNATLLEDMHISLRTCQVIEVESLLSVAQLARNNGNLQEALSAATQLSLLLKDAKVSTGLNFSAASMQETAAVLWETGEAAASVKMLRSIMSAGDGEQQDLPIGESGLLASLARQLADARLEKPNEILDHCLRPAIKHLKDRNEGQEAGKVFYEFAAFCDRQLQHPGNTQDFNRIVRLRDKKLADVEELDEMSKKSRKGTVDRKEVNKARQWFEIDDAEYQRLKLARDDFLQQSLQNYLLALHASDDHDMCVLRFFAMWLESCGSNPANAIVSSHLGGVPSRKFVVLNNQLMSRLENDQSDFQNLLKKLMQRICADHPHHSLHHLFSATRKPASGGDNAARSRYEAATSIRTALHAIPQKVDLITRVFRADNAYDEFAYSSVESLLQDGKMKVSVKQFRPAETLIGRIRNYQVPPATISVPLRADSNYNDVPEVHKFSTTMSIMGGLSHPKVLTAIASDGKAYKQLFKGTKDDDLRQDAIMEQVFEEVSKMLRSHKATRQRNLQVRTYKVIPLTTKSGIMEWVPNSIPIGEWLRPAHAKYHPLSLKSGDASTKIRAVEHEPKERRIKEFRKICDQMPPVLRHFFFERFDDPDEWFEKRTAYTRTTAAISILGHVLGLGDRHCQNILLDEKTGEAVHIDLGVAFEAGKVLPVPEKVPFRLSRDIVDAMGITKTEGVFRRCCEFTMDALREDKDSIMTLLNVLRYDPLYNWTVSPLRAKRMQDAAQGIGNGANAEEANSRKKEQEAGEADRALSIVEKKLSKTLSTAATVNELIQQATDEGNLATLFAGWSAFF